MRRNLGILGLAGVLAACASFTAADPPPVPPGDDAADAGQDAPTASADGRPDGGSPFCEGQANALCVDFEDGLRGAGWSGEAHVSPTATSGTIEPVAAPLRDGTRALRAQLSAPNSPAGATVELRTDTLDGAAHVELDVYVVGPGASVGSAVTLISLSREQPIGFLAEVNLAALTATRGALRVYTETLGGTGGRSKDKVAFEIEYDRWYRIRLGADLVGQGTGLAQVTLVEPGKSDPVSVDVPRAAPPNEATVETGIGLWRESGTGNESLEAYFDNVVAGPGL